MDQPRESPVQAGRVTAGDPNKRGYRRCLMQIASTIIGIPSQASFKEKNDVDV
jgi:hypothetical protein